MNRRMLLALVPAFLLAKSYWHPSIETEVRLEPNGDVHVIQDRTYYFNGSFSWAYVDLARQGSEDIVLNDVLERTPDGWQEARGLETENRAKSLYVRWQYSAEDEERVFRLDYLVKAAVRRYEDVAEFYWKVVEDEHEPVKETRVDIVLPGPSPELFKVYVHSAARPGRLSFSPGFDTAYVEQQGIPKNAFVETRVLCEPGLFPDAPKLAGNRYQRILDEEKRNFIASSAKRYVLLPLALLLFLPVPLVLLLVFYFRYGREPEVSYEAIYEHEPPREAPPVAVPLILHQKPGKSSMYQPIFQGMMATLLDLGRRGAVSVHETKKGRKSKYEFRLDKPDLVERGGPFARTVVEFLFGQVAGGQGTLTEDAIKQYGRGHSSSVQSTLGEVFDAGKAWWRRELGVDFVEASSAKATVFYGLWAFLSIGLGALALAQALGAIAPGLGPGRVVVSVAVGGALFMVFVLLGQSIHRWNPAALLEHRRWKAFRRFLGDFSAIEQAPVTLLAIWEQYYVYAVVLGVAQEFLKHVTRLAEQRGTALALPVWYVAAAGSPGTGMASFAEGLAGFQSFAANVTSMMSSFSVASSSGGGFSGGGGGGGGGGSSGAG